MDGCERGSSMCHGRYRTLRGGCCIWWTGCALGGHYGEAMRPRHKTHIEDMTSSQHEEIRNRIASMSNVDPVTGCWNWSGGTNKQGYGLMSVGNRTASAHRTSYRVFVGKIKPADGYHGMCVCHSCDNPPCVNPAHMFLATQTNNMRDCAKKGRSPRALADRNGTRTRPDRIARGERSARSRTTSDAVLDIREKYRMGVANMPELASRHGLSKSTVFDIIKRRTWRHI